MKKMELYTLRRKKDGALAVPSFISNSEADFCVSVEVSLWFTKTVCSGLWNVPSYELADAARTSTDWFNAQWETPNHNESPDDLEVVKVIDIIA